jgi:hypothetical protein
MVVREQMLGKGGSRPSAIRYHATIRRLSQSAITGPPSDRGNPQAGGPIEVSNISTLRIAVILVSWGRSRRYAGYYFTMSLNAIKLPKGRLRTDLNRYQNDTEESIHVMFFRRRRRSCWARGVSTADRSLAHSPR